MSAATALRHGAVRAVEVLGEARAQVGVVRDRAAAQVARAHGVGIAPGTITSALDRFDDHLRLPFGYEPEVTEEGLRRLASAWDEYRHLRSSSPGPARAPR